MWGAAADLPSRKQAGAHQGLSLIVYLGWWVGMAGAVCCWIGCATAPLRVSWANPLPSLCFDILGPLLCIGAISLAGSISQNMDKWAETADHFLGVTLISQLSLGYLFELRSLRAQVDEAGEDQGIVATVRILISGYNGLQAARDYHRVYQGWYYAGSLMLIVSVSLAMLRIFLLRVQSHRATALPIKTHHRSAPPWLTWFYCLGAIGVGVAMVFVLARHNTRQAISWEQTKQPHTYRDSGPQSVRQDFALSSAHFAKKKVTKELRLTSTQTGFSFNLETESGRAIYAFSVSKSASRYLGCFVEPWLVNLRDLAHDLGELPADSMAVSANVCGSRCHDQGMRYYGLQRAVGGVSCHCGNSYGRYERRPDWECEVECPGRPTAENVHDCVGWFKRSIYEASDDEKRYNVTQGYAPVHGRKVSSWSEISSADIQMGHPPLWGVSVLIQFQHQDRICDPGSTRWDGEQYSCTGVVGYERCCLNTGGVGTEGLVIRIALNGQPLPPMETLQPMEALRLVSNLRLDRAELVFFQNLDPKRSSVLKEPSRKSDLKSQMGFNPAGALGQNRDAAQLFVGILSAPQNLLLRTAHRTGWMKSIPDGVVVRFFIGLDPSPVKQQHIEAEAKQYGDIVIVPYSESYRAIANKTRSILVYGATAVQAHFTMKCDDDSFVHIHGIKRMLDTAAGRSSTKELYIGFFSTFAAPHRKKGHKWYVSTTQWPRNVFPPFAHGAGYIVTRGLGAWIAKHKASLPILHVEDVSVGIWVEQAVLLGGLAVSMIHDSRFHYESNSEFGGVPCLDGDLVLHHVSPVTQVCLAKQPRFIDCSCWVHTSTGYRVAEAALQSNPDDDVT